MLFSPGLTINLHCFLIKLLGLSIVFLFIREQGQISQNGGEIRVLTGKYLPVYRKSLLEKWFCLLILPLIQIEQGQIIDDLCCLSMLQSKSLYAKRLDTDIE